MNYHLETEGRILPTWVMWFILLWLSLVDRSASRVINLMNYTTPVMLGSDRLNQDHISTEEKLLRYLFKDYNPNVMPRQNLNESFKLYVGLAMSQLINIVKEEIIFYKIIITNIIINN